MPEPVNLTIEFLNAAQGDEAASILKQAFHQTDEQAREIVVRMLERNKTHDRVAMLAASIDGKLAGVIACHKPVDNDPDDVYGVTNLAVDPAARRHGIGRKLLAAAETFISGEWLKGQFGFARLADYTKRARPDSHFYEDAGYVPDEEMAGQPQTDPVLVKPLNEEAFPLAEPDTPAP
jgi:GNAT superfamily N-acetyltransferase